MRAQARSCRSARLRGALLVCVLAALPLSSGCPDDEKPQVQPLEGSQPGSLRYVVYLTGEPPDLTEYKKALADSPGDVPTIVDGLRKNAEFRRKGFEQTLKAFGGRVVDHWYLTNAVTVEIPANAAASLPALDGVERVVPDQPLAL